MRALVAALTAAVLIVGATPLTAAAAAGVTADQLRNGPVPELCWHPAGQLHDGQLLAEEVGTGNVWFVDSALGKISSKVKHGAAAIISCYAGGVSWPDNIVLYGPGPTVLGTIDLGEVFDDQGMEERPRAESVKVSKGVTTVEVNGIARGSQSPNFGSASATIKIAYRNGAFKVISRVIRHEVWQVKRLLSALKSGRTSAVSKVVGSKAKAKSALRWYKDLGKDKKFSSCTELSGYDDYRWTCNVGIGTIEVAYDSSTGRHQLADWYILAC